MMYIIDLPDVVLEHIFSFLSHDTIAQNRIVCRKFNETGGKMLNKGYYAADRFHGKTLKAIKAKLPRRESERRVHPLARQCDILIAIETRLSMLAMTFTKWMEAKMCCFIPGKVIDEIMKVLRCVANNPNPPRAHEILQELRDISSMAMEHFDEKILPRLKSSMGVPQFLQGSGDRPYFEGTGRTDAEDLSSDVLKPRVCILPSPQPGMPQPATITVTEFNKLVIKESLNRRKLKAQSLLLAKQTLEISELRKTVEEWESKLRDLTANLIKSKELPSTSASSPTPTSPPPSSENGDEQKAKKRRRENMDLKMSKKLRISRGTKLTDEVSR